MGERAADVKRIVVLANSRKYGGRCVAGREVTLDARGEPSFGDWIRPVSDAETGELSPLHRRLADGEEPLPLDIVDVPVRLARHDSAQPENWLIDDMRPWSRVGRLSAARLPQLAEHPDGLWLEEGSPTDRVSVGGLAQRPPAQSLHLLHLGACRVEVVPGEHCRLRFEYNRVRYNLSLTDLDFETRYERRLVGRDSLLLEDIFVCVSLGAPFHGYHYKLAATILPPRSRVPLYTIGHSSLSTEELIGLLRLHEIEAVADVRSQPHSARFPQFSRNPLHTALREAGIQYVYLGKELGARRDEQWCYVGGQAKYERIAQTSEFKKGIKRIVAGSATHRIALLCAEKDPLTCHRTVLVCRRLWHAGFEITHILSDGQLESQERAEQRLMQEEGVNPNQMALLALDGNTDDPNPLDRAYSSRGDKLAYRLDVMALPDDRDFD